MTHALYRRCEGISIQEMDGELFLADDENGSIYRLNVIAAAFWRALECPRDLDAIVTLFCQAFPEQSPSDLRHDITILADRLEEECLISREEA